MKLPIILADDPRLADLLPFTFTRPVWDLRCGIYTQKERWTLLRPDETVYFKGSGNLEASFTHLPAAPQALLVNSGFFPDAEILRLLADPQPETVLYAANGTWIAAVVHTEWLATQTEPIASAQLEEAGLKVVQTGISPIEIRYPEDLFRLNGELIRLDFPLASAQAPSVGITDPHTVVYGKDNLYVAPGASIRAAIINAEDGPVYIGKQATIQEGAIIARPHAFCDHATVAMGAKLRGDTTVGPWCKVGGEVSNSILMGYSNKGHDGYLGNSVIGYWCNLGADTNNSNLKNNYANVKLWHYPTGRFRDTGLQFCGLMMGDHSKCGINTMFNTGTVIGVSANIFGAGFPRNFVPSFSWGGSAGYKTYQFGKAMEVAELVMSRRGLQLSDQERDLLQSVFDDTAQYRKF